MLGQSLREMYESLGPVECVGLLREGLDKGEFKPEDFSLRELAESFCGYEWVKRLNPRNVQRFAQLSVMEAGEGVDVSAFSDITGQILYTRIMDGWKQAVANVEKLVETVPTQFDGERIPWLGHITEEGLTVRPGELYPEMRFGERYIDTPRTDKFGMIVSLTKEMIFFDRTSMALRQANEAGERLGMGKAKRIWDVILGNTNNYKLNGTSYNTYQTSTPWINALGSWPLVDWTSIEKAYILASQNLDPDTNNPIDWQPKQLVVMPAKLFTARRIVNATMVRTMTPGFATSGNPQNTEAPSPIPDQLDVITSPIAYQRLLSPGGISSTNANDYWGIGDFPAAVKYMENWPITTLQAPPNSIKEFEQDIVVRVKASERGAASMWEPRKVFLFHNA